jgi:hypothetical protein
MNSSVLQKSRGHTYIGRGGVNATADLYTEIHSFFTREPKSSLLSLTEGRGTSASGPALGHGRVGWAWLGCAAAGTGRALRTADAVGCTAAFRGW